MQLRTQEARRPKHAFGSPLPPAPLVDPLPELVAAQAEVERLTEQLAVCEEHLRQRSGRLRRCESALDGWQRRARTAEDVLNSLPAEIALPHRLVVGLVAERDEALHLARRYRAAWTNARRRALPDINALVGAEDDTRPVVALGAQGWHATSEASP